jgi:hypothetical protein
MRELYYVTVAVMTPTTKEMVLKCVWNHPGTHRKHIASHFGIHPNVASDTVKALVREQWITESKSTQPSVGRTPIALSMDLERHAALSVAYARSSMTCGPCPCWT